MRLLACFCAAALLLVGMNDAAVAQPQAQVSPELAKAFVDHVGGTALSVLQDKSKDEATKRTELNQLFAQSVDIPYVAKFVLGRYWRTATPEQQQAYMAAYEPFLIQNYVGRVARYSGQTYKLTEAKQTDGGAVVGMILHTPDGSSPDVIVNYRLNAVGKSFKVIDIVVEGVSLLNTQRSEFSSVVGNRGMDYLIEALKKKAAQAK